MTRIGLVEMRPSAAWIMDRLTSAPTDFRAAPPGSRLTRAGAPTNAGIDATRSAAWLCPPGHDGSTAGTPVRLPRNSTDITHV
jgi:hypothetical protein